MPQRLSIPRLRKPKKSSSTLKRRKIPNPRCPSTRKVSQNSPTKMKDQNSLRWTTISWIHSVKKPMFSKRSLLKRKNKASTSFSAKNKFSRIRPIKRKLRKRRPKRRENKKNLRKSKRKKLAKSRFNLIKLWRLTSRKLKMILLISKTCFIAPMLQSRMRPLTILPHLPSRLIPLLNRT